MKSIDKQIGSLLFDRLEEHISNSKISPKERIPKYRSVLEDIFKTLTADAPMFFNDLHSRTVYIFKEFKTPSDIEEKIRSLRVFANDVVHNSEFTPTLKDDLKSAYQLAEILSYFSKLPVPKNVFDYYKSDIEAFKKIEPIKKVVKPRYDFFAVIENVFLPYGDLEGKFCVLTCNTDTLGTIKLKLWNNKKENGFGSDLSNFGKIVEPYQYIYVTNVIQHKDKEDEYNTTDGSIIVLEPDYLVDAKDLSDCRQFSKNSPTKYEDNPLLFILNRFTKGEITDRIMVGNIVGKMLDDIVAEKQYQYEKSFETLMRENSYGMLCMANEDGNYVRDNIESVYLEARDHEDKLTHIVNSYKDKKIILEPTFISNKYGLQGRLDMLVEHGGESNQKDIIELKSSRKYPSAQMGLYVNHEAQTLCYELLISSVFPDRIGKSSILYSSAPLEEKPLRWVSEEKIYSKQDLIMLRNRIVASELKLAKGDFRPFYEILSESFGPYPVFLEDQVNEFKTIINSLDNTLKQYFLGFLQFIYREIQVAKVGSSDSYNKSNGFADLWKASKVEKLENTDVLVELEVNEVTDNFHISLNLKKDLFSSNNANISSFRGGDLAILYPTPNQNELNPLSSQILKCYVVSVDYTSVTVSLINKQVDKSFFNSTKFWALERDFRESGYKQLFNLLYQFIKSNKRVIDLVLGVEKPTFNNELNIQKNELDEVQHLNVQNAVRANDYYLIQGPPGTGKTSKVLVEIVRNSIKPDKAIMVVAFTNRAVDQICEKLIELKVDCIRLGKGDKPYYWSSLSGRLKLDELNEEVKKHNVFVSTISTFSNSLDLLKFKNFDTIIIDEASQVLEPQVVGFLKHFSKWIFIGDENQLPAVVLQSEDDSKCDVKELNDISLLNYRESLFYRLKKNAIKKGWHNCYGTLKYQYRMHRDIAEFPKKYFYNNELEEANEDQKGKMPNYSAFNDDAINQVLTKSRVVFIPSKVDLNSKTNMEEASLVASLINHIAKLQGKDFNPEKSVGVITPFRAQIVNIRNQLGARYREVTIDTVERFQGSERNIIIVSFAIKSPVQLGAIQSLNDEGIDRKLNVALTRAKDLLILIGSETVLEKSNVFKNLIDFTKSKGGYMLNPLKVKTIPKNLF